VTENIEIEYEIDERDGWRDVDDDRRHRRLRPGRERPPRWRLAPVLVVGALAVVVASVVVTSRSEPKQATVATTVPATAALSKSTEQTTLDETTSSAPTVASSSTAGAIVVSTTELGAPLLPSVTGTKLVALRNATLVEVDVDAGVIRETQLPRLDSTGPMMVVAGSDWAIVRPLDNVAGYIIRDDQPANTLKGALGAGTWAIYLGPDDRHVWVPTYGENGPFGPLQLVDLDGNLAGDAPLDGLQPVGVDSARRPVVQGVGGTYLVDGDALRRLTTGALWAIGTSTSVVEECDDAHHCTLVGIDNASRERRPLPFAAPSTSFGIGTVSPDGRYATYVREVEGLRQVRLLDLVGGDETSLPLADQSSLVVDVGLGVSSSSSLIWSADGRYLFFLGLGGTLSAYDVTTGQAAPLGSNLVVGLSRLTARPRT